MTRVSAAAIPREQLSACDSSSQVKKSASHSMSVLDDLAETGGKLAVRERVESVRVSTIDAEPAGGRRRSCSCPCG